MRTLSYDEVFGHLLEIMRKHGLSWVAAQVQEQIRDGKPVTKSIEKSKLTTYQLSVLDEPVQKPRKALSEVAAVEEYSPSECILVAVEALEHAVVHGAEIRREVHEVLHKKLLSNVPVRFEPEALEEAEPFALEPPDQDHQAAIDKLKQLLLTLRREV